MDLIVPFITGLTAGGLSCLAVQGGLLASSVAHEVEQSVRNTPAGRLLKPEPAKPAARNTKKTAAAQSRQGHARPATSVSPADSESARTAGIPAAPPRAARPIALFLAAKLVAYTILGALLGLLGSVMQLSLLTQALLQAAVGVFMVGTALRMLNVHPIFRYFVLEPPRSVTRYIRRTAKGDASAVTPLFLGALTVLIPCGVTQAMMAAAISTGSALEGAVTMFAFTLGASPVFFAVAYLATQLGSRLEAGFMRFVAVVVLVLGLVSIDAGATLAGWPYSVTNLRLAANAQTLAAEAASTSAVPLGSSRSSGSSYQSAAESAPKDAAAGGSRASAADGGSLTINVVNSGYQPNVQHARPNQAYKLSLVTKNTRSCSRAFVIPSLRIQQTLPQTGTVVVDLPPQKAGSKLYYSCSMGMYSGVIIFDS